MLLQGVQEGRKVILWMGVLVERSQATCCLEGACTGRAATSAFEALQETRAGVTPCQCGAAQVWGPASSAGRWRLAGGGWCCQQVMQRSSQEGLTSWNSMHK